jgi:hypothetical protein
VDALGDLYDHPPCLGKGDTNVVVFPHGDIPSLVYVPPGAPVRKVITFAQSVTKSLCESKGNGVFYVPYTSLIVNTQCRHHPTFCSRSVYMHGRNKPFHVFRFLSLFVYQGADAANGTLVAFMQPLAAMRSTDHGATWVHSTPPINESAGPNSRWCCPQSLYVSTLAFVLCGCTSSQCLRSHNSMCVNSDAKKSPLQFDE